MPTSLTHSLTQSLSVPPAGLLASSFGFAQFLSSLFWGKMSDIQGRRPVLLLGLASTVVCTVIFGTAQSFAWALTIRTAHGLLNGYVASIQVVRSLGWLTHTHTTSSRSSLARSLCSNTGVVKTYLAEITDSSNRAKAFSIFGLCGGAGRIGAYRAHPSLRMCECVHT